MNQRLARRRFLTTALGGLGAAAALVSTRAGSARNQPPSLAHLQLSDFTLISPTGFRISAPGSKAVPATLFRSTTSTPDNNRPETSRQPFSVAWSATGSELPTDGIFTLSHRSWPYTLDIFMVRVGLPDTPARYEAVFA